MSERWTESDVGDQTGRVALVTGANSGIGFETARVLAEHGAQVVLACRNREKAAQARQRIRQTAPDALVEILDVDLADLDAVARAAGQFAGAHDRLDLLINNAGLMAIPSGKTAQGYEMQFGVNHLAAFALTGRLVDRLIATQGSRVVAVSSQGHRPGRIDFDNLASPDHYSPWRAYFQSKLANLLFTRELDRRFRRADVSVARWRPTPVELGPTSVMRIRVASSTPLRTRRARSSSGSFSSPRRWVPCRRCGPRRTPRSMAATTSVPTGSWSNAATRSGSVAVVARATRKRPPGSGRSRRN